MRSVIESKVYAATIGSGAGAIVGSFLLWVLAVVFWHAPADADNAVKAVAAVPAPVSGVVGLVLTIGGAFLAGYLAPHTDRPDLPTVQAEVTVPVAPSNVEPPAAPAPEPAAPLA